MQSRELSDHNQRYRSRCRGRQHSARQAAVPVTVSNVTRQRNKFRMDKIFEKLIGTECCSARWVGGVRKERCEEESARTRAYRNEQRWRAENRSSASLSHIMSPLVESSEHQRKKQIRNQTEVECVCVCERAGKNDVASRKRSGLRLHRIWSDLFFC